MDELIKFVITLLCLAVTTFLIPYLKARTDISKYDKLLTYTEYAVRSAEQIYKMNESKLKKEYVYNYILEKANDLGVGLNEADVDLLVEGVVNFVKYGNQE